MNKILKSALIMMASLISFSALAAPVAFIEGVHYKATAQIIPTSDASKVEVMELFSFSCPHCNNLEPLVHEWQTTLSDDVVFNQVPAIFRESWMQLAKVYYAAEATGDLEQLHPLLFKAFHVDKRHLNTEEQLLDFVAEQGIDREAFAKTMNSFSVKSKVKRALVISQTSGITGVPAMIVNGKYRTDATLAGSMANMLKVVDFLILQEANK